MSFFNLPQGLSSSELLSESFAEGVNTGLQEKLSAHLLSQKRNAIEESFREKGYPDELAKLASLASTGGQTEIMKTLLEARKRGLGGEEMVEKETVSTDEGLTPSEKVKREEGRFSKQMEKYDKLETSAMKFGQEQMRLQRLQELNERGDLPRGLGRANVSFKSGELRLPFLSSPDSQEFIKIVNDFLSGAKETFGARVTNFEVNRFLKRLPSLLNTEEGRRRVLRQMEIMNQLNSLHSQGTLDEFDERGGVRKIDFDEASRIARKKNASKIKELQKEYISLDKTPEEEEEVIIMTDPSGARRRVPKAEVEKAQKAGYKSAK